MRVETCSGFEEGSYLRLIASVCHSTLGVRVIKKEEEGRTSQPPDGRVPSRAASAGFDAPKLGGTVFVFGLGD